MPHRAQELPKLKPQKQKTGSGIELYGKKENGRVAGLTGGQMPCSANSGKRMYNKQEAFSCHFITRLSKHTEKVKYTSVYSHLNLTINVLLHFYHDIDIHLFIFPYQPSIYLISDAFQSCRREHTSLLSTSACILSPRVQTL